MPLNMRKGWYNESERHSLARKGIKTGRKNNSNNNQMTVKKLEPSDMDKRRYHGEVEKYQGWANRETWAVKLHWDNSEGDYNYLTEKAREFKKEGKSDYEFAEFLKEYGDDIYESVEEGNGTKEGKMFVQDVGSLWRVDWNEIANSYYDEVEE